MIGKDMDKAQKELIKTYARFRLISAEQNPEYRLTGDEKTAFAKHNVVDPEKWTDGDLHGILTDDPSTVENLKSVLDKLDGRSHINAAGVLVRKPELAPYFNIKKLPVQHILRLLKMQPQFFDEVKDVLEDQMDDIPPRELKWLLIKRPELMEFFEKAVLNTDIGDVMEMVQTNPKLAEKLPQYWKDQLSKNSHIIQLMLHPERAEELYDEMKTYPGYAVSPLIKLHPDIAEKLPLKDIYDAPYNIARLLEFRPDLFDHFDQGVFSKMDNYDIENLLKDQPAFVKKFSKQQLDDLSEADITTILIWQPQLVDYLDVYDMDREYVRDILAYQPKLEKHFKHGESVKDEHYG